MIGAEIDGDVYVVSRLIERKVDSLFKLFDGRMPRALAG